MNVPYCVIVLLADDADSEKTLSDKYDGIFAKVDMDNFDIPQLGVVLSIPTFLIYVKSEGKWTCDTLVGAHEEKLEAVVAKHCQKKL
ncbi:thioredoxin domain-containing protein [Cardiosporidium cionae]|uniref:Thioredoxin domain-containing protein n=1 Tax=Cardiosporidium cionae TaxID=476202 RepID=A0ABQ7JAA6_9APIC|nr:thioredoxin domain-containing protein [Cardiosporidium cionae]|eukprot:KAF8820937.1 thioredoxin domain-containing protein [Cardiosporidium cionae]